MSNHAMIDIETLGVGVSAPLFEIGVCVFNLEEKLILGSRQIDVDILDVMLKTGFCSQVETLEWWRGQDYDPTVKRRVTPLALALQMLNEVIDNNNVEKVWANSPSFDCVILERHYEACGIPRSWTFRQELDFRTMLWFAEEKGWQRPVEILKHRAENDAVSQANQLLEIISYVEADRSALD